MHTLERWGGRQSQKRALLLWRRGAENPPTSLSTGYQALRAQHATEMPHPAGAHPKAVDTLPLCSAARRQGRLRRSPWRGNGCVGERRQRVERPDDRPDLLWFCWRSLRAVTPTEYHSGPGRLLSQKESNDWNLLEHKVANYRDGFFWQEAHLSAIG